MSSGGFRTSSVLTSLPTGLPVWRDARVVKATPDKAQVSVTVRALREGKVVYLAVPKLAGTKPFYLLDPRRLPVPPEEAAVPKIAARVAPAVEVDALDPVDLAVCGSVAVSRGGVRVGKGAGYADLELALLGEAGLIGADTVIATTVHDLQVIDGDLPETEHDFGIDLIVTPTRTITCDAPRRRPGLLWEHLTTDKIAAIPALEARRVRRGWPR
ncbi:5-formyltetrahydrofolate cyclo-ligase [Actinokineospora auranticolor]|uniref:5-formyltetrahydrofolate cyclo-ligase n=1 Tax=Actinokineospora auranticolor TaxID=155976 RepID=A0A2S6GSA3_9PSEU|nr:5-formyltetrahydrofolate cyclo-ligase [Actinokineospora auranticolor]PPK68066.1 5-formyltetrahydrofolate cyclo-ligase [Actinokineospora auranticolor]